MLEYQIGDLVACEFTSWGRMDGTKITTQDHDDNDIGIIVNIFYTPFHTRIKVFHFKTHYISVFSTDGIVGRHTQIISR